MKDNRTATLAPSDAAELIDSLVPGQDMPKLFCESLVSKINKLAPFELVAIVVYHRFGAPSGIYDNFESPTHRLGLKNYLNYTYILNPSYNSFLEGDVSGVKRLPELVPTSRKAQPGEEAPIIASQLEEIGFVTEGWPEAREEVLILTQLDSDTLFEIGLLKPKNADGFSSSDISALCEYKVLIDALIRSFWRAAGHSYASKRSRVESAIDSFCSDALSPREQQIARMILKGHSSNSISLNLSIALPTVKTHRRNIYWKLGIATQSELLALFLKGIDKKS